MTRAVATTETTEVISWYLFFKRLWLRDRACVLLSEGRWVDSPGLHVNVSLDKILNPKTAPDVLDGTLHGSHRHQRMYELFKVALDRSVC